MPKRNMSEAKTTNQHRIDRLILLFFIGFIVLVAFDIALEAVLRHQSQPKPFPEEPLVILPDHPRHLVDFSLVDQAGHAITRKDLYHKIVVVNFIFTSCTLVCPYINAHIAQIRQQTVNDPDVRFLSLTLDPADDTVSVLAKYYQKYSESPARPDSWSFVTGDESIMRNLVGTSFLSPDTTGDFAYMPGNFANSQRIVLVDFNGDIVKYFDGLNAQVADAVVQEIRKLEHASVCSHM